MVASASVGEVPSLSDRAPARATPEDGAKRPSMPRWASKFGRLTKTLHHAIAAEVREVKRDVKDGIKDVKNGFQEVGGKLADAQTWRDLPRKTREELSGVRQGLKDIHATNQEMFGFGSASCSRSCPVDETQLIRGVATLQIGNQAAPQEPVAPGSRGQPPSMRRQQSAPAASMRRRGKGTSNQLVAVSLLPATRPVAVLDRQVEEDEEEQERQTEVELKPVEQAGSASVKDDARSPPADDADACGATHMAAPRLSTALPVATGPRLSAAMPIAAGSAPLHLARLDDGQPRPPSSSSWDWPLTRTEKATRVLMIDQQMNHMDRLALLGEVKELRRLSCGQSRSPDADGVSASVCHDQIET